LKVPIEVRAGYKELVHKGVETYVALLDLFLKS